MYTCLPLTFLTTTTTTTIQSSKSYSNLFCTNNFHKQKELDAADFYTEELSALSDPLSFSSDVCVLCPAVMQRPPTQFKAQIKALTTYFSFFVPWSEQAKPARCFALPFACHTTHLNFSFGYDSFHNSRWWALDLSDPVFLLI